MSMHNPSPMSDAQKKAQALANVVRFPTGFTTRIGGIKAPLAGGKDLGKRVWREAYAEALKNEYYKGTT